MADPYSDYWANRGLLSGPALNPMGIDPERLRQITGILSQPMEPGPTLPGGVAYKYAEENVFPQVQNASDLGAYAVGQKDLSQDQLVDKGAQAAMALAGGGMPMAEAGAAGLFGGRLAANAEKQSGWFKSPIDKLDRFEIPDQRSKFTMPQSEGVTRLKDVLDHPELYDAYPELKNTRVSLNPDMTANASFDPKSGSITLNSNLSPTNAHSSLLHEVQHAIQQQEGFAGGSNSAYEAAKLRELQSKVDKAQNVQGDPAVLGRLKGMESTLSDIHPYDLYSRVAGEVEARNVQTRQNYGILARQGWPAWVTQDVPWAAQLKR